MSRGISVIWKIGALVISGLLLTFFAWQYSKQTVQKQSEERFNFQAKQILVAIEDRMQTYEHVLRGAVWAASLVGAIGLGYGAHSWRDAATAVAPTPISVVPTPVATVPAPAQQIAASGRLRPLDRPAPRSTPAHSLEGIGTDTLDAAPSGPAGGLWRTESLDRAVASGLSVPREIGRAHV